MSISVSNWRELEQTPSCGQAGTANTGEDNSLPIRWPDPVTWTGITVRARGQLAVPGTAWPRPPFVELGNQTPTLGGKWRGRRRRHRGPRQETGHDQDRASQAAPLHREQQAWVEEREEPAVVGGTRGVERGDSQTQAGLGGWFLRATGGQGVIKAEALGGCAEPSRHPTRVPACPTGAIGLACLLHGARSCWARRAAREFLVWLASMQRGGPRGVGWRTSTPRPGMPQQRDGAVHMRSPRERALQSAPKPSASRQLHGRWGGRAGNISEAGGGVRTLVLGAPGQGSRPLLTAG